MEPNELRSELSSPPRKNSNIIYFLIGIIAFLIGTNIFVYLKKNETTQKLITQTAQAKDEKASMQEELNKLESDLASATNSTKKLTSDLQAKDTELKDKITQLKKALREKSMSSSELVRAREDIKQLRFFIQKYNNDISVLKDQNKVLTTENTGLKTTVDSVKRKTTELVSQNDVLTKKVNTASALKTSGINVTPVKVRSNGKETEVKSARKTSKIKVQFSIADNDLSSEGSHDIYLIILDPADKIETGESSGNFRTADGKDMQYTTRTSINYIRANRDYTLEWPKNAELVPGDYKVIMYGDGYKMGESTFTLKKGGLFN
mgnify:CR=1 FL=1|jgi:myosin heavy subunit